MSSQGSKNWAWTMLTILFRPLDGRAWPTMAGLFFVCIIGLSTYHLWRQYGPEVLAQPRYQLDTSRLKVTPQPEYIRSDVIESAIVHGQLRNANLLRKDIVLQIKQSLEVQPWVKEVLTVNKRFPSTVEVDLRYRRPVAMVEMPPGVIPGYDYPGLLPVDDEAYSLPVEMTAQEANEMPKIAGVDSSPAGPVGSPWGDTRVAEAVEIIALLEEIWAPLGLRKVEVPQRRQLGDPLGAAAPELYYLVTAKHKFTWGPAAGKEPPGEDTAQQKANELKQFVEQFRITLDEWKEQTEPPAASVGQLIDWKRRL